MGGDLNIWPKSVKDANVFPLSSRACFLSTVEGDTACLLVLQSSLSTVAE